MARRACSIASDEMGNWPASMICRSPKSARGVGSSVQAAAGGGERDAGLARLPGAGHEQAISVSALTIASDRASAAGLVAAGGRSKSQRNDIREARKIERIFHEFS